MRGYRQLCFPHFDGPTTMILSPFEDRLSDVPRWVIVRTIQKQSVMDHSARVAIVAPRIAIQYFRVRKDDYETLYQVSRLALLHDRPEAFSGDIPTPAKKWWMGTKHDHFHSSRFKEHPETNDLLCRIVKAADYFEALVFLAKEFSLGNKSLSAVRNNVVDNFHKNFQDMEEMVDDLLTRAGEFANQSQDPLA